MATIKEIQQRLELVTELSDSFLEEVAKDQRCGVQKAVEKRKKVIQAELDEDLRLDQMLRYEKELYQAGYQAIAGIDEVGRGPLAGPVVAAAVMETTALLSYAPVLGVIGILTGVCIGTAARFVLQKVPG